MASRIKALARIFADWTNGRRYAVASGDMILTDDPEAIAAFEQF